MAHKQEILELLNVWKKKKFRKTDLSLSDAVASLNTDDPVVAIRPGLTASKWVVSSSKYTITSHGDFLYDIDLQQYH